ncbi:MAG: hypothetical protein AAF631_14940, partial [Pseudomonadota bacterium]
MTRHVFPSAFAALAVALASPAAAQERAQEVLDEYLSGMTEAGLTVTPGATAQTDSSVEYTDVAVTGPDGLSMTLDFVRATELDSERVRLEYPESFVITVDPAGAQPEAAVNYEVSGTDHIVTGNAGARQHDVTYTSVSVSFEGPVDPQGNLSFAVTMNDVVASYLRGGTGDVPNWTGTFKAAVMGMTQAVNDASGKVLAEVNYNNAEFTFDADAFNSDNAVELLTGARNLSIGFTTASSTTNVDMATSDLDGVIAASSGRSEGTYSIVDGGLSVVTAGQDTKVSFKARSVPLPPFEGEMDTLTMTVAMPLKKTEDAMPADIELGLTGLKLSDTIWGMFDPGGSRPPGGGKHKKDVYAQAQVRGVLAAAGQW